MEFSQQISTPVVQKNKSSFLFKTPTLPKFKGLREQGELLDVTLKVDDRTFCAHKVVLAATIPYFRTMFLSDFVEKKKDIIELEAIDPAMLELLIDFAYTGQVALTEENVEGLMLAASFFLVDEVIQACIDYMKTHLSSKNVFSFRLLSFTFSCPDLTKITDNYILKYFGRVAQLIGFLALPIKSVCDFITRGDIYVNSNDVIFNAIIRDLVVEAKNYHLLAGIRSSLKNFSSVKWRNYDMAQLSDDEYP